jgi:nucleoid-associated protein YgaU
MGIFDFLKGAGKSVDADKAEHEIHADITAALGDQIDDLTVTFEDGTVTLSGMVDYHSSKQKAVLLAGNVEGVEKVNDDALTVKPLEVHRQEAEAFKAEQAEKEAEAPDFTFYTIQSGDTLSGIAKKHYGDATKWRELYEANREVIEDPDKIYPGQQIRVPASSDA